LVEGAAPRMPKVFDFSPVRRPNFILGVQVFYKTPARTEFKVWQGTSAVAH